MRIICKLEILLFQSFIRIKGFHFKFIIRLMLGICIGCQSFWTYNILDCRLEIRATKVGCWLDDVYLKENGYAHAFAVRVWVGALKSRNSSRMRICPENRPARTHMMFRQSRLMHLKRTNSLGSDIKSFCSLGFT